MVENARRLFMLIAALVIGSILLIAVPEKPIKLGLDLAGGVRLVYGLDFEQAYKDGALDRTESKDKVIEETIAIIRGRVDPDGVRNPTIRRLGLDRIEIALPGSVQIQGKIARGSLAGDVAGPTEPERQLEPIRLAGTESDHAGFPGSGGVIEIGGEKIRYSSRTAELLYVSRRGEAATPVAAHTAGSGVELVSDDQIERLITELGDMRFYIGATPAMFTAKGKDFAASQQQVVEWLKRPENAQVSLTSYNSLPEANGGPPEGFRWYAHRVEEGQVASPREERLQALAVPPPEWTFTGSHLESVNKTPDDIGFPAVSFKMRQEKVAAFTDFTTAHVDEPMAIVLNDEVVSFANINEPLPGQAQISGRFTDRQVDSMVSVLRSGSLQIRPVLQQREDVGATVGQEYVDQGWIMGLTAVGMIMVFMIWYFGWLGLYASIGLAINLLMQLAALVAFQATLTMPGIAGIILGVGMAVDANILIFDRMREEQESGKKPLQAAIGGFQHAMSAIVDSNVTTVLSGFILYFIGTGPIRGFAVTLIIGVLTSMFAALVIVRLLVHWHMERHPGEPFRVKRWLADANFKIVSKTKYAVSISALLMALGLGLFIWLPAQKKFGIDFLGGATVRVRTEAPQDRAAIETRVKAMGGDFSSAEVAGLPSSKTADGRYTQFRITFKAAYEAGKAETQTGSEGFFKSEVARGLADVLQEDQLELTQNQGVEASEVKGTLYFEEGHPLADISARLEAAQLKNVQASYRETGREGIVSFSATTRSGISDFDLESMVKTAIVGATDSGGKELRFAEAIPESSIIGRQVVGELRDSAIKALLLSMFVTVIYIRVRFSEYSFGFAAVSSLIHDLVFTVGAISFLIAFPYIHTEFDMGSIAVFLTIVGYSINDTIIVFDRIRENRPRMQGTLEEVVDRSINQTLSRTILTSGTTVATIGVVLLFNLGTGNVLEGFAFAMVFGIATGTFSSIYIAAPIFIFLEKRAIRRAEEERKLEEKLARASSGKAASA